VLAKHIISRVLFYARAKHQRDSIPPTYTKRGIKMGNDTKIPGKRRRRCAICDNLKYGVKILTNPYTKEFENEEIKEAICPNCYKELSNEI
jgi:hypothetical protein